ncbi:MAG: hypothetical protein RRY29_06685 [Desulfovibrionaceae bacterium]
MKGSFLSYLLGLCVVLYAMPLAAQKNPTVNPAPPQASAHQESKTEPTTLAEERELWSGSLYTSTYRAGACIAPDGTVRGVLLLRTSSGAVDTYHFSGKRENGSIQAQHSSGHAFLGSFPSDTIITGTITLKSGRTITLSGMRQRGVELDESCRPLPK